MSGLSWTGTCDNWTQFRFPFQTSKLRMLTTLCMWNVELLWQIGFVTVLSDLCSTSTYPIFVSCGRSMRILCQRAAVASYNCIIVGATHHPSCMSCILGSSLYPILTSQIFDPHALLSFVIHCPNFEGVASQGKNFPAGSAAPALSGEYKWPNFVRGKGKGMDEIGLFFCWNWIHNSGRGRGLPCCAVHPSHARFFDRK